MFLVLINLYLNPFCCVDSESLIRSLDLLLGCYPSFLLLTNHNHSKCKETYNLPKRCECNILVMHKIYFTHILLIAIAIDSERMGKGRRRKRWGTNPLASKVQCNPLLVVSVGGCVIKYQRDQRENQIFSAYEQQRDRHNEAFVGCLGGSL